MRRLVFTAAMLSACAVALSACGGYGPLGEPPTGLAGVKAAAHEHETARLGQTGSTPSTVHPGGATAGSVDAPTVGPTDQPQPH